MGDWPAPKGDLKIRYGKWKQGDVLIFVFSKSPQAFDCGIKSTWKTWDSDQKVKEVALLPSTLIKESKSQRSGALHTQWDWKKEVRCAFPSSLLEFGHMGFSLFTFRQFDVKKMSGEFRTLVCLKIKNNICTLLTSEFWGKFKVLWKYFFFFSFFFNCLMDFKLWEDSLLQEKTNSFWPISQMLYLPDITRWQRYTHHTKIQCITDWEMKECASDITLMLKGSLLQSPLLKVKKREL